MSIQVIFSNSTVVDWVASWRVNRVTWVVHLQDISERLAPMGTGAPRVSAWRDIAAGRSGVAYVGRGSGRWSRRACRWSQDSQVVTEGTYRSPNPLSRWGSRGAGASGLSVMIQMSDVLFGAITAGRIIALVCPAVCRLHAERGHPKWSACIRPYEA